MWGNSMAIGICASEAGFFAFVISLTLSTHLSLSLQAWQVDTSIIVSASFLTPHHKNVTCYEMFQSASDLD
jgi:hypothetical protein